MELLIFIIVVYVVFRLSARYLFPYLLKRYIKKAQSRFYEQSGQNPSDNQHYSSSEKPKVTINYPGRKKHFAVNDIDYTEYEEIKDSETNNDNP